MVNMREIHRYEVDVQMRESLVKCVRLIAFIKIPEYPRFSLTVLC